MIQHASKLVAQPSAAALSFGAVVDPGPLQATRQWTGLMGGTTAFVTVYTRGHALGAGSSWTTWGNTSSDLYVFSMGSANNVCLAMLFDRQANGYLMVSFWNHPPDSESTLSVPALLGAPFTVSSMIGKPTLQVTVAARRWVDSKRRPIYRLLTRSYGKVGPFSVESEGRVGGTAGVPAWETGQVIDTSATSNDAFNRFGCTQRLVSAPPFSLGPPLLPGFPHLGIVPPSGFMGIKNTIPIQFVPSSGALKVNSWVGGYNGEAAGHFRSSSLTEPPKIDFDTPWLFARYLPSSDRPQLTCKTNHSFSGDPFSVAAPLSSLHVRYSWTDEHGQAFHYNISNGGKCPSWLDGSVTSVVGATRIEAPGPSSFTEMCLSVPAQGRSFVQVMGQGVVSGEGIYFYRLYRNPQVGSLEYPTLTSSNENIQYQLAAGMRGEYQIPSVGKKPILYLCPLDALVHLYGANGGVWYSGGSNIVRVSDSDNDGYIDTWMRQAIPDQSIAKNGVTQEILVQSGMQVTYGSGSTVKIYAAAKPLHTAAYYPPSDGTTWWNWCMATKPYRTGLTPTDLSRWLPSSRRIQAAYAGSLEAPLPGAGGWTAKLHVKAVYALPRPFRGMFPDKPGDYLVTARGNEGIRVT